MTKLTCISTTKTGSPCKASPLKGTSHCLAHSDEKARGSAGFGGAQAGAGRPALPKPTDVMRRLVEENVTAVLRPHFRTLGFDVVIGEHGPELVEFDGGPAKLYGTSKDGDICVSGYDDLGAMMAAAEKLFDRVYGRPKQQTEITGANDGPVEIVAPVARPDQLSAVDLVRRVLPVVAVNGNGNGHHSLN